VRKGEKVAIGWITSGSIYNDFAISIIEILHHRSDIIMQTPLSSKGSYISMNRHHLVEQFLGTDCDWLLMLDTDVIITTTDFDVLIEGADDETTPILSGKYFFYFPEEAVKYKVGAMTPEGWLESYPENSIVRGLSSVGCGYVLIHRKVFEKIRDDNPGMISPWFWNGLDAKSGVELSEDNNFFNQATKSGFPIALHTGASSRHLGKIAVTEDLFLNQHNQ
jgi:hypothetical protein